MKQKRTTYVAESYEGFDIGQSHLEDYAVIFPSLPSPLFHTPMETKPSMCGLIQTNDMLYINTCVLGLKDCKILQIHLCDKEELIDNIIC